MIGVSNAAAFDQILQIESPTNDDTEGMRTSTWTVLYADVRAKELRASTSEVYQERQQAGRTLKAWMVRKHDRVLTPQMRVTDADNNIWYVIGWHLFKGRRNLLVIEAEYRDDAQE